MLHYEITQNKQCIVDLNISEIADLLASSGFQSFRAKQITDWIYKKLEFDFSRMNNLPVKLRDLLTSSFNSVSLNMHSVIESKIDDVYKMRFKTYDNRLIEAVVMKRDGKGFTLCISTQIGCPIGCVFCASGANGFIRNLSAGEIVAQVLFAEKFLGEKEMENRQGKKEKLIKSILLMGMGEPLLNFDNVVTALKNISSNWGFSIGLNRIVLSSVGFIDKLKKLIELKVTPKLAISLHSSDDDIRRKIIPCEFNYSVSELVKFMSWYKKKTSKKVTVEYVLVKDLNDSETDAMKLAKLLRNSGIKVNLIPYNEVKSLNFKQVSEDRINTFMNVLTQNDIFVTLRKSRGKDILGACGQLELVTNPS